MELKVVVVPHKGRGMVQRSRRVGVVAVGRNRSRLVDEGSLTFRGRKGEIIYLLFWVRGQRQRERSLVEWGRISGLWGLYRIGNVNYL
jgi:hypothetical protein